MDAGRIHFVPESKLDITHSMGFRQSTSVFLVHPMIPTLCFPGLSGIWTPIALLPSLLVNRTTTISGLLVSAPDVSAKKNNQNQNCWNNFARIC